MNLKGWRSLQNRNMKIENNFAPIITVIGKRGMGKTSLVKELSIGKKRVLVFDPLLEYDNFRLIDELPDEAPRIFRYRLTAGIEESRDIINEACYWCYNEGNMLFICDEADLIFDVHKPLEEGLNYIVQYGRHRNVSLITVARRPALLNRNLTALSSEYYFFRITEPRDLQYVKMTFGADVMTKVSNLEQFEYLRLEN